MTDVITPVLLSGGTGTRLWPLSREVLPKQFLALTGARTLIQETALRVAGQDFPVPVVICARDHRFLVAEQLRHAGVAGARIVLEPARRGTAPAAAVAALLVAQWLRQAGVNAELASSDWGTMLTRRNSKAAPAEGGWNIFFTAATGYELSNPATASGHGARGEKSWFGWPTNERQEQLRDAWAAAETLADRQAIARDIQANAWDYVQHVYLGQFYRAAAWRKNVKGIIAMPEVVPFWNIEKTA